MVATNLDLANKIDINYDDLGVYLLNFLRKNRWGFNFFKKLHLGPITLES
jgi:hypothetical protein